MNFLRGLAHYAAKRLEQKLLPACRYCAAVALLELRRFEQLRRSRGLVASQHQVVALLSQQIDSCAMLRGGACVLGGVDP
ncbi:MAG: hypothetical protein ABI460_16555 [Caldimonas sp.]